MPMLPKFDMKPNPIKDPENGPTEKDIVPNKIEDKKPGEQNDNPKNKKKPKKEREIVDMYGQYLKNPKNPYEKENYMPEK